MALSAALLRAVAAATAPEAARVFRPGPTAAFGRLDALLPGYGAALDVAAGLGYTAVVREAGGRAAMYDGDSVVVELFRTRSASMAGVHERFAHLAELLRATLGALGCPVQVGELPGEYCPGAYSLHLPGGPKVAGVAQRIVRGGTMTAAVITVRGGDRLRSAVSAVYAALGLPVDPRAAGALADRHPGIAVADVHAALVRACASL